MAVDPVLDLDVDPVLGLAGGHRLDPVDDDPRLVRAAARARTSNASRKQTWSVRGANT